MQEEDKKVKIANYQIICRYYFYHKVVIIKSIFKARNCDAFWDFLAFKYILIVFLKQIR